jgi:hypothetical protein
MPAFQLLFVIDGIFNGRVLMKPDKLGQSVSFCEAFALVRSMLVDAPEQVRSYADIKRSVCLVREDLRVATFFHTKCYGWSKVIISANRHPEFISGFIYASEGLRHD